MFLAGNGFVDVLEVFEVDEAMDRVAGGVSAGELFAVGGDALSQVVCHADVEVSRTAGEDIDPEPVFAGRHASHGSRVGYRTADPLRG